jgi:hypothetical protein
MDNDRKAEAKGRNSRHDGFEVFTAVVMKSIIFRDMTPCSPLGFCLPPACVLVLAELISYTLKMKAICSSEMSVETQRTTRPHNPEAEMIFLKNVGNRHLKDHIIITRIRKN